MATVRKDTEAFGPSVTTILVVVILGASTILLTWRAKVLEATLERDSESPALIDKRAPDFAASALNGRIVSLADFRGKQSVVVTFWASWCLPCRMELPTLAEFYRNNHSASSNFEILAVSIDEDPKSVRDFTAAQKLQLPVLLDPQRKIDDAYEVDTIPTTFIIDKDGKIAYGRVGYDMNLEYSLSRELRIDEK